MTGPREDESGRLPADEADLRSILTGEDRRTEPHVHESGPHQAGDAAGTIPGARSDEPVAPYVPPFRDGDDAPGERPSRRADHPRGGDQPKLPPVWPGDEDQPWFRRERGLPPAPGSPQRDSDYSRVDPEELPTALADIPARGRAWGVTVLLPNVIGFIPTIGLIFSVVFLIPNLFLFRQGQDVGAVLFRLRVLRENGDVAGFFQMFVRNAASNISLLLLGAGYLSAFSDPLRRTWHDRWLGTYVVKDSPEYRSRRRSSSEMAFNWFWVIILLLIAASVLYALSLPLPTEAVPTDGGGGG